ncbi:CHAD domain-containing protein [Aureimonas sp. SA4125]|uniref:CHAD domain-containing protein n=1 Tax=Aureimonas sp. SA4125 TaxID=2826993 RepID=UPI001CC74566|nr:CHAD domain-containing protein [Aureimonas sp. SA4125]BDA86386.1 CHAD domain-containing protein [Aureimonas sp. SA4125]
MSYRITPGLPLDAEIRRIAEEQIDKATVELSAPEPGEDPHEAIHDVRKRFKKLRALVLLAKSGDPGFARTENARYRDASRALSGVRDRTALIEALDALAEHVPAGLSQSATAPAIATLRADLEEKRQTALAGEGDLGATIAATLTTLADSRDAAGMLAFHRPVKDAAKVLATGFAATHGRARAALKRALRSGAVEDLHELRKHVKYLSYHLALLAPLWPETFEPLRRTAADIGDDLGRDHDYAVLREELAPEAERHALVLALMDRRQAELQAAALLSARRLLSDKPDAVAARIKRLFRIAAEDTPAEEAEALRQAAQ